MDLMDLFLNSMSVGRVFASSGSESHSIVPLKYGLFLKAELLNVLCLKDRQQLVRRYLGHCSFLCTYALYIHILYIK